VKEAIMAAGTQLAFVHPGSERDAMIVADHGLGDVARVDDRDGVLYRAFGLARGSLWQIAGPPVWLGGLRALWSGHGVGQAGGDVLRMPGVFLIHDGQVKKSFRHRSSADRPDYVALARPS
jgi:hypothetical protein